MKNWAGNLTYRSRRLLEPESIEELAGIVRGSSRIRALGTRHSFNGLADTQGDHVSLAQLAAPIHIDPDAGTVTVGGGQRYGELCQALESAGWALANLASLPHISTQRQERLVSLLRQETFVVRTGSTALCFITPLNRRRNHLLRLEHLWSGCSQE